MTELVVPAMLAEPAGPWGLEGPVDQSDQWVLVVQLALRVLVNQSRLADPEAPSLPAGLVDPATQWLLAGPSHLADLAGQQLRQCPWPP